MSVDCIKTLFLNFCHVLYDAKQKSAEALIRHHSSSIMEQIDGSTADGHSPGPGQVTVLFCSHDFERGFLYTQEACKSLPGIHVSSPLTCPLYG